MWYRNFPKQFKKKAGIIEKLKYQASSQLTDEEMITLKDMLFNFYQYDQLPNLETLKNYFLKIFKKINGQKFQNLSQYEIGREVKNLQKVINVLSSSVETKDKTIMFIPILAEISKAMKNLPNIFNLNSSDIYIGPFDGDRIYLVRSDNLAGKIHHNETHDLIYNFGYQRLINLLKEGIDLNPSLVLSIVTDNDIKTSDLLNDSPERQELKKLILEKYPESQKFNLDIVSKDEFFKNILENVKNNEKPDYFTAFTQTSISEKDYIDLIEYFSQNDALCILDPNRHIILNLSNENLMKIIELFYNKCDDKKLLSLFYALKMAIKMKLIDENYQSFSKYIKKLPDQRPDFTSQDTIFIFAASEGIYGQDERVKQWLSFTDFQKNSFYKNNPVSKDEIEEYNTRNKIQKPEKIEKEKLEESDDTQKVKSILDYFVISGDITRNSLANSKDYELSKKIAYALYINIFENNPDFNERDEKIFDKIALNTTVYEVHNTKLYDYLQKNGPFGILTPDMKNSLGFFHPYFSESFDQKSGPVIFLNTFHSEAASEQQILKTLGIKRNQIEQLTAAHEIAHLIHYFILGGKSGVFQQIDPKYSLQPNEIYNKSRLYLTDMRELVARTYGNLPLMADFLHAKVEELRSQDLIKEAILDEMVDTMHRMDPLHFEGFPIKRLIEEQLERGLPPYNLSERPYQAANKTIERTRAKLKSLLYGQMLYKRRELTLETLKEINKLKIQIQSLIDEFQQNEENQNKINTLQNDLQTLNQKLTEIRQGNYDYDLNIMINVLAQYISLKDLKITQQIVSDPTFNPPMSVFDPKSPENKAIPPGAELLSEKELQDIRDFDIRLLEQKGEPSQKDKIKGRTKSFMAFDIKNPKWREMVEPDLEIPQETKEEDKDLFTAFNHKSWKKFGK